MNYIRKAMKNMLITILLCSVPLLCTSCFTETDLGYPKKVSFSKEGGAKNISGEIKFTNASVSDYNATHEMEMWTEGEVQYIVYDWLKVEYYNNFSSELQLYAEPNTTGKSRTLYISLYSGPQYQEIKVKQDK